MTERYFQDPEMHARVNSIHALGRVGVPDEIGKAVLYLASEEASLHRHPSGDRRRLDRRQSHVIGGGEEVGRETTVQPPAPLESRGGHAPVFG